MKTTQNLKLPQYVGEDIFELDVINDAYSKIDEAYGVIINHRDSAIETEASRVENENTRVANEQNRVSAETSRVNAEKSRVSAEQNRVNAESTRVSNENTRVTEFNKIKSDNKALETSINEKVDAKLLEVENSNSTFKTEVNNTIKEFKTETDNKYNSFKTEINNKHDSFKSEINNINSEFRTEITNNNNSFKSEITKSNEEFKTEINESFGNAKTDYFGKEHDNVVNRLNNDFDNVHQRINDSTYLEYSGTNIKADNSYYGLTRDLSIKGRTLQNLILKLRGIYNDVIKENNKITIPYTVANFGGVKYEILGKANTTYTVLINVLETFDGGIGHKIEINDGSYMYNKKLNIGLNIFTITTNEIMTSYPHLTVCKVSTATGGNLIYDNIAVFEGDYTNTPISDIPFGEGIYSVGEKENNSITVKNYGKNLIDISRFTSDTYNEVSIEGSTITVKGTKAKAYSAVTYNFDVNLIKGKTIYLQCAEMTHSGNKASAHVQLNLVDSTGKKLYHGISITSLVARYNIPYNITSCAINIYSNNSADVEQHTTIVKDVQLSVADSKPKYYPYQESKTSVQLDEPLRSLPNGVCDEILEDGTEIRRIEKFVLNGTHEFVFAINSSGLAKYCRIILPRPSLTNLSTFKIRCDKLSVANPYGSDESNIIMVYGNELRFRLNSSTMSVEDIRDSLKNNPITVYYELAEPIIKKHNKNINLKTFEGTTHITSDNYLLPTLSCKVPSNVQALVMSLKEENEELARELKNTNLELEEKTTQLEEMDTDLVATAWDMDFRVCELEWLLEDVIGESAVMSLNIEKNTKVKRGENNMALSRYEQAKIMIVGGSYNKITLTKQLTTYLNRGYISQEEYDELIALMEAKELVMEEI